ncbi:hypothetical protein BA059_04975 [Mycolicibacterium sp. (ex Dasyatis americana)]|nr:hypothetical protein BA059_04975 [Mycolicibacterium sp. (ex Dasyatis americana)]
MAQGSGVISASGGELLLRRYDDVAAVLRSDGWSSDPRRNANASPEVHHVPSTVLLFMDPPDHARLRKLVRPPFTALSIDTLAPRIAAIIDAALDELSTIGGDFDLIAEFARIVPLAVVSEMFDLGVDGARLVDEHIPALVGMLQVDADDRQLAASIDAAFELSTFLTPLIAARRRHPGDDALSALVRQPGITAQEVLATCIIVLAAGLESVSNAIANATLALLQNPDQIPQLLNDPVSAVEELVRHSGPVKLIRRVADRDHTVGGHRIRAGDSVLCDLRSANWDPSRFTDPERLDLGRKAKGHLAFSSGAHFCLGTALAKVEVTEAVCSLFERYPGLMLKDTTPQWRASRSTHALEHLTVSLC